MNEKLRNPTGWSSCPPGEFRRLGQQLAARARRRHIAKLAGMALFAVAGVALAVGAGNLLPHDKTAASLSCADVRLLAKDYLAGRLDGSRAALFKAHLAKCPRCAKSIGKLGSGSESGKPLSQCEGSGPHRCGGSDCETPK